MRCFYHHDAEAVGLCKYCSRGICPDCVTETDASLACKGRHEAQVERISLMIHRNAAVHGRPGAIHYIQLAVFLLVALAAAVWAARSFADGDQTLGMMLVFMAGMFGVLSASFLRWVLVKSPKDAAKGEG